MTGLLGYFGALNPTRKGLICDVQNILSKLVRHILVFVVALLCVVASVGTNASAHQADGLPVEDVARISELDPFTPVRFSPNGKWLAYLVHDRGIQATTTASILRPGAGLWLLNTTNGHPRNLTNGTNHDWLPEWSPDGRLLAFVSDRDGSGQPRLWIWDTGKDDLKKVSDIRVRTSQLIEWAPDSRSIFVTVAPQGLSVDQYLKDIQADATGKRPIVEGPPPFNGSLIPIDCRTGKCGASNKRLLEP